MTTRRDDKEDTARFQTDRIFHLSNGWFFSTREGENFGPFASKAEAESMVLIYTRVYVGVTKAA